MRFLTPMALAIFLSACATSNMPSFGENLLQRSAEQQALADKWTRGEKLSVAGQKAIKSGNDKVARGQKLLEEGKAELAQGEANVAAGDTLKNEAVNGYQAIRANPLTLPDGTLPTSAPAN